ncbi:MAG: tannase/feruloyl esterase family alpha/beta hydrolase [Rhodospirillaceae bacterium]|nr:MAG: tannase/feruloyl esterase family alpha/beta hydrolase [Rhodospirillaceae bacterium]
MPSCQRHVVRIRRSVLCLAFILAVVAASGTRAAPVAACADLAKISFAGIPDAPTAILSATLVAASDKLPAYCRVRGTVISHVGFELRLPLDAWNGKFFMQGCHGYCGQIEIDDADDALARGYATAATDLGHSGTPSDPIWAYNNRDAEIDFGFRATHVVAVASKAIVEVFQGKAPDFSYFRGCSDGGREGLVEAERFPVDFNGIVAGAPSAFKSSALSTYWTAMANLDVNKHALLTPQLVYLLRGAVMAKCDALDGLKDGILEDPRQCNFDPAELACKGFAVGGFVSRSDCLTPVQVEAAKKIYDGPVTSDGASLTAGGQTLGSELNWLGDIVAADGGPGTNLKLAEENFRYFAFAEDPGPAYRVEQFNLDRDAERLNFMQQLVTGFNPDLRRFRDRGGRLVLYQGWQDGSASNTVDFYDTATETLGGEDDTLPFFRLFMVPGMNQCAGGPGVNTFDLLSVIEDWVEFGKAPDSMLGTHRDENGTLGFSRPVYAYPNFARYDGNKDRVAPEAFKRQTPKP